jgi:hypothetical protein
MLMLYCRCEQLQKFLLRRQRLTMYLNLAVLRQLSMLFRHLSNKRLLCHRWLLQLHELRSVPLFQYLNLLQLQQTTFPLIPMMHQFLSTKYLRYQ